MPEQSALRRGLGIGIIIIPSPINGLSFAAVCKKRQNLIVPSQPVTAYARILPLCCFNLPPWNSRPKVPAARDGNCAGPPS